MKHLYQILVCVLCLLAHCTLYSQHTQIEMGEKQTFTEAFDSVYQHVDFSNTPHGILYDRVVGFAKLSTFNRQYSDTSSYWHFIQSYSELFRSAIGTSTLPITISALKSTSKLSIIPIGIINFDYSAIDTISFLSGQLYQQNGLWYQDYSKSSSVYKTNQTIVIAPIHEKYEGYQFVFVVSLDFYFSNNDDGIDSLFIDYDDGAGFRETSVLGEENTINYNSSGLKILSFRIIFQNGTSLTTHAKIVVEDTPSSENQKKLSIPCSLTGTVTPITVSAQIPYKGIGESKTYYGQADMYIYYGSNTSNQIRKPVLILDGFDPQDNRSVYDLWNRFNYNNNQNVGCKLLELGYDIIIMNMPKYDATATDGTTCSIDGGSDFIQRNAFVCIEIINYINNQLLLNNSNEKIVVVGPSMGGQITRYALRYMELNSNDSRCNYGKHNCRLWTSFDSPHVGANIAYSAQSFLNYYANSLAGEFVKDKYEKTLCNTAAKQMLLLHVADAEKIYYTSYYNDISNLGYPTNLRKIAVSNGSLNGTKTGEDHSVAFSFVASFGSATLRIISRENSSSDSSEIAYLYVPFSPIRKPKANLGKNCGLDASPGGIYYTFQLLYNEISPLNGTASNGLILSLCSNCIHLYHPAHCFIPTYSSLGYLSGYSNTCQNLSIPNLINQNKIPFSSAWGPTNKNMDHVTFDESLANYLINEVETYIKGPDEITDCGIYTYTVNIPAGKTATITWDLGNLTEISRNDAEHTITVRWNGQPGGVWVKAASSNLEHKKELAKYNITTHYTNNNLGTVLPYTKIENGTTLTLNSSAHLTGHLKVFAGSTLILNNPDATYSFSPNSNIILEDGAQLEIHGATLTNACPNEMWKGIHVAAGAEGPYQQ